MYLSVGLFLVRLPACPASPSLPLSGVCLSVCLSVCILSFCPYVYVYACPSVSPVPIYLVI